MKYKLLVLDVDGTLLNDAKEISKRTKAALLKVQQMGVRIVLASGRPTFGLIPLAKILELNNYGGFIVSYNGCQIIKAENGEILFERRINPEILPYLEKKARKNGFAIFTTKTGEIYGIGKNEYGQLGTGDTISRNEFVRCPMLEE